jgi:ribosomal protein S19
MRASWKYNYFPKRVHTILETHKNLVKTTNYLIEEKKNQMYLLKKKVITNVQNIAHANNNLQQIKEISKKKKFVTIWNPNLYISSDCLDINFNVYNGKTFTRLLISKYMVGKTFGSYLFTRKLGKQKKKK